MRISMPEQKPSTSSTHLANDSRPTSITLSQDNAEAKQNNAGGDGDEEDDDKSASKWNKCGKIMWKIFTSQLGLIVLLLCYTFAGAAIFQAIEEPNEQREIDNIENARSKFIADTYALAHKHETTVEFDKDMKELLEKYEIKLTYLITHGISAGKDDTVWDYWGSLFFCATIFTTIGKYDYPSQVFVYKHRNKITNWSQQQRIPA